MMFKKITIEVVMAVLCQKKLKAKRLKLKAYLLIVLLYFLMGQLQAQELGTVAGDVNLKGVQIGQQVPDVLIEGLHNYKDASGKSVSSARISDFKGKLLILDFFATWCSPCVAMIPKMDSLQRVFGDKIAFLSVSYQSEREVLPFLERLEKQSGKRYDLPVATAEKQLKKLFPHHSLPHYVWIDEQGRFRAVTEMDKVNGDYIKGFLRGEGSAWAQKVDVEPRVYNKELPMFLGNNGGAPGSLIFHSMLSGYTEGMGSGLSYYGPQYKNGQKITARNLTVKSLFSLAHSDYQINLDGNRIVFEVKDASKLTNKAMGMEYLNWMRQGNGFCYELVVPSSLRDSAFRIMRSDLNRFFPQYKIGVEEREMSCWVLKVVEFKDKVLTKGGTPFIKLDKTGGRLVNTPITKLVNSLDRYYMQKSNFPIIDGTGLTVNVDLELNCSLTSIDELNLALEGYGLKFVKEFRKVGVLVFRDNPSFNDLKGATR